MNEAIVRAAIEALSGAVPNPIGKATFFFGKSIILIYGVKSKKTSDAVAIYSSKESKLFIRGLIVNN